MGFLDDLDRHLDAIRCRDLAALAETVADDGVVMITSEGEIVRGRERFLDMHADWFATPGWTIEVRPVHALEREGLASAVLELTYRESREDADLVQTSVLSLLFERHGDRWLMVHDQNTPVSG